MSIKLGKVDTVIKNGKLVTSSDILDVGIAINEGKVVQMSSERILPPAEKTIDARGKLIFPGLFDPHLHILQMRTAGHSKADDYESLTKASAFGGTTTFMDFVVLFDTEKSLKDSLNRGLRDSKLSHIDYAFHGGLTGCVVKTYEQIEEAIDYGVEAGIASYKLLMDYRSRGLWLSNDLLFHAIQYINQKEAMTLVHCEDGYLCDYFDEMFKKDPRARSVEYCVKNYHKHRPSFIEEIAVKTLLAMGRYANAPVYIVHTSSKEGLWAIRDAKRVGQKVFCEVCVPYLYYSEENIEEGGPLLRCCPPIRFKEDLEAMWQGVSDGTVDVVASDHTSQTKAEKDLGYTDWFRTPVGVPSAEEKLQVFYNEAVVKRDLSPTLITRLMSENPAKIFGLYPKKGSLMVGSDADLVMLDPKKERTFRAEDVKSNCGYSIFEGMTVKGVPTLTMLRGKVLVEDGEFYGTPGFGSYITRPTRTKR